MYTNRENPVRERLLEGALRCLEEKGFADTTARDIARESGANLRSIGYHFGSTRGLLLAAISLNFKRWLEPLIAAARAEQSAPSERLRVGMARFAEALPDNAPMLRAWLEAIVLAAHDAELRETLAGNQREFRAALTQTLAETGAARPEVAAGAIVSVCDGLIVRFLLHGEAPSAEETSRAAAEALSPLEEP